MNEGNRYFHISSPDKKIVCTFGIKSSIFKKDFPFYSISYNNQVVLSDSKLGLILEKNNPLTESFEITNVFRNYYDSTYTFSFGERKLIRNRYNESIFCLKERDAPFRKLEIIFRIYDEGVAFRYIIPQQNKLEQLVILSEETQFVFNDNHFAYREDKTDGEYQKVKLSNLKYPCENPLTIELNNGIYSCITEANVDDYSRMILNVSDKFLDKMIMRLSNSYVIKSSLCSRVYANKSYYPLPLLSPWRVILFGTKPGILIENNYLLYNLNPSGKYKNIDWIKPGKVMREVTLTTNGAIKLLDFAEKHNIQYIEFDAGWYGLGYNQEHNPDSNAKIPIKEIDLLKVIEYAKKKNIGVILYINKESLQIQTFPLYSKWGIKGLKFGFINGRDQSGVNSLKKAIINAYENKLIVDIHDNFRPSGTNRTYPNLLTQEGILGNENFPTAKQNTILPFTRLIAGAADYTIAYYSNKLKVTKAHQLAASIIFFSPLQFIFWGDNPDCYKGEKEIEFFDNLPVVWDDTKVIDGKIGEFIIITRRAGKEWYVGIITNENERKVSIPLTFLDMDKTYTAIIYSDNTNKSVSINKQIVSRNKTLNINLLKSGGVAIKISPLIK